MKTFKCNFGGGISCEVTAPDTKPAGGTYLNFQWSGKTNKSVLRPYIAWMNSVNQQLSNEWNITITHLFQVEKVESDRCMEIWSYQPGGRPKCHGRTSINATADHINSDHYDNVMMSARPKGFQLL